MNAIAPTLQAFFTDRLMTQRQGGIQHVDDLSVPVDRPLHVPPDSVDPDVRLVYEPPITR